MGKGKLAALQRLFEPPSLSNLPPTHLSTLFNVVMVRWGRRVGGGVRGDGCGREGWGTIFMHSFRSAVCTLLKEGLYVYLCRSVAQREENTVISTNALS